MGGVTRGGVSEVATAWGQALFDQATSAGPLAWTAVPALALIVGGIAWGVARRGQTARQDVRALRSTTEASAIRIVSKSPKQCTDQEKAQFEQMVRESGEVDPVGLADRINQAKRLIFCRKGKRLVGVAALKKPEAHHRNGVATSAGVPLPGTDWPYELGWVFVTPSEQGIGYAKLLVKRAMDAAGDAGVFATSRTDNAAMHKILVRDHEFEATERPYASRRRPGTMLRLFLRHGRR